MFINFDDADFVYDDIKIREDFWGLELYCRILSGQGVSLEGL